MFPLPARRFGPFPPVVPMTRFPGPFIPRQLLPLPPPLPEPLPLTLLPSLPPPLPLQVFPIRKYLRRPSMPVAPPPRTYRQMPFQPAFGTLPSSFRMLPRRPFRYPRSFMNMQMRRLYDGYDSDELEDRIERNRERLENMDENYGRGNLNERLDSRLDQYSDYRERRFGLRNGRNLRNSEARSDFIDARREEIENRFEASAERAEAANEFQEEREENMNEQRSEMLENMSEQMEKGGGYMGNRLPYFTGRSRQMLAVGYYKS